MTRKLDEAIRLYDRFTHEGMDRRAFMAELARIAGGAAAAAALLTSIAPKAGAQPRVAPNDRRIRAEDLQWEVLPGRLYRGYSATPQAAADDLPAVLVIHENRGLNDHIRDVTRRVALAGFHAVAPDFLSPAGGTPPDEDRARTLIGELDMTRAVADGAAMIRNLASAGPRPRKVGIVGFCWGGAMVHRLAVAAGADLSAGVSFYGPAPEPSQAALVRAPLLIHLAERDERVNRTALPWVAALRNSRREVRAINYHGVDHAFHNDTSQARYDRRAAVRAWRETVAFLNRHLR